MAHSLAAMKARFTYLDDRGEIFGLPGNSQPSGRDSRQYCRSTSSRLGDNMACRSLLPLRFLDMDQHALAVVVSKTRRRHDIADLEVADLRCPQPGLVADAKGRPILQSGPGHRGQKLCDLFHAQHHRQLPRLAMELHVSRSAGKRSPGSFSDPPYSPRVRR